MTSDAVHRYAVYFAPRADSAWWRAGSRWLGRCASRLEPLPQAPLPGVPTPELHRLTQAPRRYGWHATLKAPFALAPGVDAEQLRAGLRGLCEDFEPFTMPTLKVAMLDDFLALVPEPGSRAIEDIAAACVTRVHALAAPLAPAEIERRRAAGLTQEEDALLLRWGYPFVLERFRFHLSLTGTLRDAAPSIVQAIEDAARERFAGLPACRFDTLSLFAEPRSGADFVLLEQMDLGA
jgi:putative phosphonate metabolism protein